MPDISGFTNFVHETDLEHSQYVVSGLLETLINANQLGLEVAEIEGDAVLFYAESRVPTPLQVLGQAQHMYREFHRWIAEYRATCPCSCPACQAVSQLTLKVVAHAGPLGFITVRQQRKPFGEAVIVLHRLLKNDIASHEYVLLTNDLLAQAAPAPAVLAVVGHRSSAAYDGLGQVGYVHVSLAEAAALLTAAQEKHFRFRRTLRHLRATLPSRLGVN